jgi:hypothetical protein
MSSTDNMTHDEILASFKAIRDQLTTLEKAVKAALKSAGKKAVNPDAPKRQAGPWALWAKAMPEVHPAEFAEFEKAKQAEMTDGKKPRGLHILFAKKWRDEHEAEWKAFEASHAAAVAHEAPAPSACAAAPAPAPAPETPKKGAGGAGAEAPRAPKKVPKKAAGGAGAPPADE